MTELLIATKKGLFCYAGEPGGEFALTARAFAGEPVEYAMRDPRTGRLLASVTNAFYGPKIWFTDDPGGEWTQADGVVLPDGDDAALVRVWTIVAGEEDGLVYAGGDPGVLFESRDAGSVVERERGALGAPDAPGLAARRRRAVPALDRAVARRPAARRARHLRRGRLADR